MRLSFIFGIILCLAGGCASVEAVDRSYVNLDSADLKVPFGVGRVTPRSSLREANQANMAGGCSTCAH
jgi:hypothetical protein